MASSSSGPAAQKASGGFLKAGTWMQVGHQDPSSPKVRADSRNQKINQLQHPRSQSEAHALGRNHRIKLPPLRSSSGTRRQLLESDCQCPTSPSLLSNGTLSGNPALGELSPVRRVQMMLSTTEDDVSVLLEQQRAKIEELKSQIGPIEELEYKDLSKVSAHEVAQLSEKVKIQRAALDKILKQQAAAWRRLDKANHDFNITENNNVELGRLLKEELSRKADLIITQAGLLSNMPSGTVKWNKTPHNQDDLRLTDSTSRAEKRSFHSPGVALFTRPKRKAMHYSARIQTLVSSPSLFKSPLPSMKPSPTKREVSRGVSRTLLDTTPLPYLSSDKQTVTKLGQTARQTTLASQIEAMHEASDAASTKLKQNPMLGQKHALDRIKDVRETLSTKKIEYLTSLAGRDGMGKRPSLGVNTCQDTLKEPETPLLGHSNTDFRDSFTLEGQRFLAQSFLNNSKRRNKTLDETQIEKKQPPIRSIEDSDFKIGGNTRYGTARVDFGRAIRKGSEGIVQEFKNASRDINNLEVGVRGSQTSSIAKKVVNQTEGHTLSKFKPQITPSITILPSEQGSSQDVKPDPDKTKNDSKSEDKLAAASPAKDLANFFRGGGLSQITKGTNLFGLASSEVRSNSYFSFNGPTHSDKLLPQTSLNKVETKDQVKEPGKTGEDGAANNELRESHQARLPASRVHINPASQFQVPNNSQDKFPQKTAVLIVETKVTEGSSKHLQNPASSKTREDSSNEIARHPSSFISKKNAAESRILPVKVTQNAGKNTLSSIKSARNYTYHGHTDGSHQHPQSVDNQGQSGSRVHPSDKKGIQIESPQTPDANPHPRASNPASSDPRPETRDPMQPGSKPAHPQPDSLPISSAAGKQATHTAAETNHAKLYNFFQIEEKSLEDVPYLLKAENRPSQRLMPARDPVPERTGGADSFRLGRLPDKMLDSVSDSKPSSRRFHGSSVWLTGLPDSKKHIQPYQTPTSGRFGFQDPTLLSAEGHAGQKLSRQKSNASWVSRQSEALRRLIPGETQDNSRDSSSDSQDTSGLWKEYITNYPSRVFLRDSEDG